MRETKKDDIIEVLKMISPGTAIREGLENILKAKTRRTYSYRRFARSFKYCRWRF